MSDGVVNMDVDYLWWAVGEIDRVLQTPDYIPQDQCSKPQVFLFLT